MIGNMPFTKLGCIMHACVCVLGDMCNVKPKLRVLKHEDMLKIFNGWNYPRNHKVEYIYKAKKGKFHAEKKKIPCKKQKTFSNVVRAIFESGRLWHFFEVNFCFRTCHPNTLVNFWHVFTIYVKHSKKFLNCKMEVLFYLT